MFKSMGEPEQHPKDLPFMRQEPVKGKESSHDLGAAWAQHGGLPSLDEVFSDAGVKEMLNTLSPEEKDRMLGEAAAMLTYALTAWLAMTEHIEKHPEDPVPTMLYIMVKNLYRQVGTAFTKWPLGDQAKRGQPTGKGEEKGKNGALDGDRPAS